MPAPTTLLELIALYIARCRIEGLSPRTQRAYSETLARFQRSVAAQGLPDAAAAVETATVIRYCESFQARRPRHPPSLLPRGSDRHIWRAVSAQGHSVSFGAIQ